MTCAAHKERNEQRECQERLKETGNDLPGVFQAVQRRVREIEKNAPGSRHLLTLPHLFREDNFSTMYELRDCPVAEPGGHHTRWAGAGQDMGCEEDNHWHA